MSIYREEHIELGTSADLALNSPPLPNARAAPRVAHPDTLSDSLPPLAPVAGMPLAFQRTTRFVRARYRRLYELPVAEHADGSRSFHDGRLYRRHGLNVLFLRGDVVEMAFQHGRLLADEIVQGAPPESARMVGNAVANALGRYGLLQRLVTEGIHRLMTNRMLGYAIEAVRGQLGDIASLHEAVALADATGIPVNDLIRALFNPEIMLLLARFSGHAESLKVKHLAAAARTACCCSSFAAWGTYTTEGQLVIGRNMDYPLNGYYDRFPTVIFYEPAGGSQRYMTFVSAGIHNAGMTAYNESGIFLASHTVPTVDMAVRGVPAFVTATQVVRRAKTFSEAVTLFEKLPPPTGWGYFLASTREGLVGTVEMSNQRVVVRAAQGDCHVQTNHYRTPEMIRRHMFLNTSVVEDIEGRFGRITQRLSQAQGRVDSAEAISILGDQIDPYVNEVRGLGSTVGVHTSLTSLVLDPARGRVFVSRGPAPAPHREFVELPLIGTFDREAFPGLPLRVHDQPSFRETHPDKLAAMQLFIEAKSAYEHRNDVPRTYELLCEVVARDPSNPAYFFQLAIFSLKLGKHDEALQRFSEVFECPYVTSQLARLSYYYRGRTHAHLGQTDAAVRDLNIVLKDKSADHKLQSAADWALWRLRLLRRCALSKHSLAIMMQHSDMLQY